MRKLFLFILVFFTLCGYAYSQQAAGQIVYAEGMQFTIGTGEQSEVYDITYDNVLGMEVFEGDFISTDPGSFLEIQITNSKNLFKISENTSFTIEESGRGGSGSFRLTYGRVRARVDKLFNREDFLVRGPSVTAGVRGTDFGYDILAISGEEGKSTVNVYCFEGKVVVDKIKKIKVQEGDQTIEKEVVVETIVLQSGEMIALKGEVLERAMVPKPVEKEIRDFWEEQDFKAEVTEETSKEEGPEKDIAEAEETSETETQKDSEEQKGEEDRREEREEQKLAEGKDQEVLTEAERKSLEKQYNNAGIGLLTTGFLAESIGITTFFFGEELLGLSQPANQVFGAGLMVSGGILIGAAIYAFSQITGLGK
jgi:hypothetical protein